jgi:hypothetical protein
MNATTPAPNRLPALLLPLALAAAGPVGAQFSALGADSGAAEFGYALAVDSAASRLAVSAPAQSAVYVYLCDAQGCGLEQRLQGVAGRGFGAALALDGDRLAVGEAGADSVRLFRRVSGSWTAETTLAAAAPLAGSRFGEALALRGERLAIGAPRQAQGAVHVFSFSGASWAQTQTVFAQDVQARRFGARLVLLPDQLLVAAPLTSSPGSYANGRVEVHAEGAAGSGFAFVQALLPAAANGGELFGQALSAQGDRLLVGSPGAAAGAGRVQVFERGLSGWSLRTSLQPPTDVSGVATRFGWSLAQDGARVLVGEPFARAPASGLCGVAHAFIDSAGTLAPAAVPYRDRQPGGLFGFAVALAGPRALIAAPGQSDAQAVGRVFSTDLALSLYGHGFELPWPSCAPAAP